ncbi:MAG: hypothetical protein PHX55_06995 [Eubacteriales bacterium]|nr:hypothetical protein [Eubacteriales bacterium]MDD3867344.1 hypothetical protein [Eubacteriales bacterium]
MKPVGHGRVGRNHWRSRKGAASVLIVLLIVVLIFFGVLALVTAAADQRLASRRADWNRQYYQADSLAEYVYASLDEIVRTSRQSGQSGENLQRDLSDWLAADPAIGDFSLSRQNDGLMLHVLVYQPEWSGQGIQLTIKVLTVETGAKLRIMGWQQWQPPIPEDDSAFDRWEGTD